MRDGGQVKALAVTTESRTAIAPAIPAMAELGLPGYASVTRLARLLRARRHAQGRDRPALH